MTQPTSGEWKATEHAVYAGNKLVLMTAIKDVPDMAEREANIKVAAASKDMLEALQILVAGFSEYSTQEKIDIAEAAIKKATV